MSREFIFQIYTDTGGDYDRAVLSDGDVMVEARLSEGYTAHIQTGTVTTRDSADDTSDAIEAAVEFVGEHLAEPERTYVV